MNTINALFFQNQDTFFLIFKKGRGRTFPLPTASCAFTFNHSCNDTQVLSSKTMTPKFYQGPSHYPYKLRPFSVLQNQAKISKVGIALSGYYNYLKIFEKFWKFLEKHSSRPKKQIF